MIIPNMIYEISGSPPRNFYQQSINNTFHFQQMHPYFMETASNTDLCEFLQVSSITLIPDENCDSLALTTRPIKGSLCTRCRRFAINSDQIVCNRCDTVLSEKNLH